MYGLKNGVCIVEEELATIGCYKVIRALTTRDNKEIKIKRFREIIEKSCVVFPEEYVYLSILNPIINEMILIYATNETQEQLDYFKEFYECLMSGYSFLSFDMWEPIIKLTTNNRHNMIDVDPKLIETIYSLFTQDFDLFSYTKINTLFYMFECLTKFGISNLDDKYLVLLDRTIEFLESKEDLIKEVCVEQLNNSSVKTPRFLAY